MGLSGLEPPTSRLSGVRSNHLSYKPILAGRFHDPFVVFWIIPYPVENTRFELVTSCLQGRRSPNWANPPWIRQPSIFPGRLQPSIVDRISLNLRVRDGNGCDPDAHRHRKYVIVLCMSSSSYCAQNFQSCFLSRYFVSFRVQHARLIHPLSIRTR